MNLAVKTMLCVEALKRDVGGRTLFHGLSFERADGESLALSAPSGFGASPVERAESAGQSGSPQALAFRSSHSASVLRPQAGEVSAPSSWESR